MRREDSDFLSGRYGTQYEQYGYSPKSLGWNKGKQEIRFSILTSPFEVEGCSFVDVGCGFGDLNKVLSTRSTDYDYTGIDLCSSFVDAARKRFGSPKRRFIVGDFLDATFDRPADVIVGSGIFNILLPSGTNGIFVAETMRKAWDLCRDGIAFDFLSNRSDFVDPETYQADPAEILKFSYGLSRNVCLRNDYMPFEFSVLVFRDASFLKEDTLFNRFKQLRSKIPFYGGM